MKIDYCCSCDGWWCFDFAGADGLGDIIIAGLMFRNLTNAIVWGNFKTARADDQENFIYEDADGLECGML